MTAQWLKAHRNLNRKNNNNNKQTVRKLNNYFNLFLQLIYNR